MKCRKCKKRIREFSRECPYCHTPIEDGHLTKKDKDAKTREKVREEFKQEPLFTIESSLYCYEDGSVTQIEGNFCNPMPEVIRMDLIR